MYVGGHSREGCASDLAQTAHHSADCQPASPQVITPDERPGEVGTHYYLAPVPVSFSQTPPVAVTYRGDSLTARERDVLALVAQGQSNKQIANALGIWEGTIKVHVKNILRKIRKTNRTQAALWWHGIVT